ncbi:hypothetical protein BaRGS_00015819, partial [Batillaria attramentaria]
IAVSAQPVRLVGGSSQYEGRVEVYINRTWGTVCDDLFDFADAKVICNMLGYPGDRIAVLSSAYYGQGSDPILLDDVECTGTEINILQCRHNAIGNNDCKHSEDAGVNCRSSSAVRLVGGQWLSEGRVEVYINGQWGTVCDDFFDDADARVVCEMLGYNVNMRLAVYPRAYYGQGTLPILLDDVECTGSEINLQNCSSNGVGNHDCTHAEDVGETVRLESFCIGGDVALALREPISTYLRRGIAAIVLAELARVMKDRHNLQTASGTWNSGNKTQRFEYCIPCPTDYDTLGEGATHPDNCTLLTVCNPGQQYNGRSCEACPYGTWNSGNETQRFEQCASCPVNYVTEGEGATYPDDCVLNCSVGQYSDDVGKVCRPCPVGSYQDMIWQYSCALCPNGTSTHTEGSSHSTDCQPVCGPGEQYNGRSCVPCPQGWWNSGNETQRFEQCALCPGEYITHGEGATHPDNCTLLNCTTGQYINVSDVEVCSPCPLGTYQDMDWQYNCTLCPDGTSTHREGSLHRTDCQREQYNGSSCVPCPQGTWNSGNRIQCFEQCVPCPQGYVSVGEGATHPDNCTLRDCPAGEYIDAKNDDSCTKCPKNSYQELPRQYSCARCPTGTVTDSEGSVLQTDCKGRYSLPPPGVETTASMELKYALVEVCTVEKENSVRTTLRTRIVEMRSDVPTLCPDVTCTNAEVTASCSGIDSRSVVAAVSLKDLPSTLTSASKGTTMTAQDMLLTAAQADAFNLTDIGAALDKNHVVIAVQQSCKEGYRKSGADCVPVRSDSSPVSAKLVAQKAGKCWSLLKPPFLHCMYEFALRKRRRNNYAQADRKLNGSSEEHSYSALGRHSHSGHAAGGDVMDLRFLRGRTSSQNNPQDGTGSDTVSVYDYIGDPLEGYDEYLTPASHPTNHHPTSTRFLEVPPVLHQLRDEPRFPQPSHPNLTPRSGDRDVSIVPTAPRMEDEAGFAASQHRLRSGAPYLSAAVPDSRPKDNGITQAPVSPHANGQGFPGIPTPFESPYQRTVVSDFPSTLADSRGPMTSTRPNVQPPTTAQAGMSQNTSSKSAQPGHPWRSKGREGALPILTPLHMGGDRSDALTYGRRFESPGSAPIPPSSKSQRFASMIPPDDELVPAPHGPRSPSSEMSPVQAGRTGVSNFNDDVIVPPMTSSRGNFERASAPQAPPPTRPKPKVNSTYFPGLRKDTVTSGPTSDVMARDQLDVGVPYRHRAPAERPSRDASAETEPNRLSSYYIPSPDY